MSGTLKRGPISFNVAREERNKKKEKEPMRRNRENQNSENTNGSEMSGFKEEEKKKNTGFSVARYICKKRRLGRAVQRLLLCRGLHVRVHQRADRWEAAFLFFFISFYTDLFYLFP
jgi:hypothetical protein